MYDVITIIGIPGMGVAVLVLFFVDKDSPWNEWRRDKKMQEKDSS